MPPVAHSRSFRQSERPIFSLRQRVALAIASVGGMGWAPIASGTVASAAAVGLYWALPLDRTVQLAILAVVIAVGVWSAGVAAAAVQDEDPSCVVIDEVAGMLIAAFLLPKTPLHLLAAFLLFRLFDIGKWPPMKQLERLPGGWGIMADDVAAGLIARLLLLCVFKT